MNEKEERLISAIGQIEEKYIKEYERKMSNRVIKIAASFAILIALGLFLFIPYAPVTSKLGAYADSEYFPLIESIDAYQISFKQPKYKNNFESLLAIIENFAGKNLGGSAPDYNASPSPEYNGSANGIYVESTDNQVEGVIEGDLFKMTDKYIFRLGYKVVYNEPLDKYSDYAYVIRVYSIDKENSALINEYEIGMFEGQKHRSNEEMYLSADCNTVTVTMKYADDSGRSHVGIVSLDVSDVTDIKEKARVSMDGSINTSRMVDGKLLMISEYSFNRNTVDYSDPATYVPAIDRGQGKEIISFEDIIFPDEASGTHYSVVALFDAESLELFGATALLNFTNDVYVSENKVYITREYSEGGTDQDGNHVTGLVSDLAILDYSGESLEKCGIIKVKGNFKDQYSFDEKDGYLRVVSSTMEMVVSNNGVVSSSSIKRNVSLYIYNLHDNSLAYSVEDFAIPGEEATAVRFMGDELYVCTAVVAKFTDPVYFFDLTDYENIIFNDTGIIEGYSTSLIDLGEGFLLGMGVESRDYSKIEVYEDAGDRVVSVDKLLFDGDVSSEYKAYLINREKNLFGFGARYFAPSDIYEVGKNYYNNVYVLVQFDGYDLNIIEICTIPSGVDPDTVRCAYVDGYLYITTLTDFVVVNVE